MKTHFEVNKRVTYIGTYHRGKTFVEVAVQYMPPAGGDTCNVNLSMADRGADDDALLVYIATFDDNQFKHFGACGTPKILKQLQNIIKKSDLPIDVKRAAGIEGKL
jgi:hypothetical protein